MAKPDIFTALRADRRAGWARVAASLDAFGVRGSDAAELRRLIRQHVRGLRPTKAGADAKQIAITYSRRKPEPRPAVPSWHHAAVMRELYVQRRLWGPRGVAEPIIHDRGTATQRARRNERLRVILRAVRPVECEHRGRAWEDEIIARYNAPRVVRPRGRDGKVGASRRPGAMMEVPAGRADTFAQWLRNGERRLTPSEIGRIGRASQVSATRRVRP